MLDGGGKVAHFSLRNLTRALTYAIKLMTKKQLASMVKPNVSLIEGILMSFCTCLDTNSAQRIGQYVYELFKVAVPKTNSLLSPP